MKSSVTMRLRNPALTLFGLLLAVGSALVLYCVVRECHSAYLHRDPASYLYEASQMLAGVPPYSARLAETNPPLILWISAIPVALGKLLHLSCILVLKLGMIAFLGGVAAWCLRLLRRSRVPQDGLDSRTLALFLLAIPLVFLLTQPDAFAQREQMLTLFLLPYVIGVSSGATEEMGKAERIALGVAAGLAICLKPFHLCTLACLELLMLLVHRSVRRLFRVELLALVLTGVAFIAAVWLFVPQYFRQLPLLREVYWAFGNYTAAAMLLKPGRKDEVILLLAWACWWGTRRWLRRPVVPAALLASATGAALAFALQHTGWPYQQYPECVLLYLGIAWLAIDLIVPRVSGILAKSWREPAFWIAAPLCVALAAGLAIKYKRYIRRHEGPVPIASQFTPYPANTPVYTLATGIGPFTEVLQHHLVWGGRFAHLWMLPAIVRNEEGPQDTTMPFKTLPPATVTALAAMLRQEAAEDLEQERPLVVAVAQCSPQIPCQGLDRPLNMLQWFSQDPRFAEQWARYRKLTTADGFNVYVRQP